MSTSVRTRREHLALARHRRRHPNVVAVQIGTRDTDTQQRHGKRGYGQQATLTDRDRLMIAARQEGHTLEEIGQAWGITRERVRQLIQRAVRRGDVQAVAVTPDATGRHLDVIMRAVRDPSISSIHDVVVRTGVDANHVSTALRAFGCLLAVRRLFRWRRTAPTRRQILVQLIAWRETYHRTPTSKEFGLVLGRRKHPDLPHYMTMQKAFGSVHRAFRAAGLEPRAVGGAGHMHPKSLRDRPVYDVEAVRRRMADAPRGSKVQVLWAWAEEQGISRSYARVLVYRRARIAEPATD